MTTFLDSGYTTHKLAGGPADLPAWYTMKIGDTVEWQRFSHHVRGVIVKMLPSEFTVRWCENMDLPLKYHKYAKVSPHRLVKV